MRLNNRKFLRNLLLTMGCVCISFTSFSQIDWGRALGAAQKTIQALTISDSQMAEYVKQSVAHMDASNKVLPETSEYVKRLKRLTAGVTNADGIPLNFKVYELKEVNAFACPDGSVRVYTGLMDIMTDDELMGVVGHEIGHVLKRHSKNAFKHELMTGAVKDVLASANGTIAKLTDSQLGSLGESLINAKYSQKQESEADDCGYDFLVSQGLNPWGIAMAFEKLSRSEGNAGQNAIQKMFSSHPDTQKRIKKMAKRAQKDGYSRP